MPRNYNHNVDIKSSQLANAIKFIFKIAGFGVAGISILAVILLILTIIRSEADKKEVLAKRETAKTLDLNRMTREFNLNYERYYANWIAHYVKYTGTVEAFRGSRYKFNPSNTFFNGSRLVVECQNSVDSRSTIARFNPGDRITVTGKSWGIEGEIVELIKCRIE